MIAKQLTQLLVKFFSVGLIATLIHSGIFTLCIALQLMSPQLSNFIAYWVALTVSYIGHQYWTFSGNQQHSQKHTILRFISVSFLGYALNSLWVLITTDSLNLSAYYALIGIGFLTPLITFSLLKLWVFTNSPS
ncbi:GtrA family protein [Aliiglaciecola lipolytica]|uniref:GtrA family protein n=1 Tax=Aliiglaciecola lipolytica TaxID=477689 RepID=UPI001C0A45EB|nr:GtrA family protein [Aliiglaciecola lipolytica]